MNILTSKAKYIPANTIVNKTQYADGNTALTAIDPISHEPAGTLTVNIPETTLNANHVWIKDWSENEGVLNALIESKLVENLNVTYPQGFCEAHLVKLTLEDKG